MTLALPAAAQTPRPIGIVVGGSVSWNSNVFSLPDNADPVARLGTSSKSDRISSYYGGVRINYPYGQQRFALDATLTAYRYRTFEQLDFDAKQYRGAWNFHLTPRVSGTLAADRAQTLVNYADFRQFNVRNVRTNENRSASADWLVFGGWHLTGGVSHHESRTEQPLADEGSFTADAASAGVRYVASAGRSIGLTLRRYDGDYTQRTPDPVNRLGDGFERDEAELGASWRVTGRSTLDGRLARLRYRENQFSERDFTGTTGRLAWSWQPTGRLSFNLAAARNLSPWRDLTATYRVEELVSLGAGWQIAPRVALNAAASVGESEFRNPLVAPAFERRDEFLSGTLGANWQPTRNLSATASVSRTRRTSTDPNSEYGTTLFTLGASFAF